MATKKKRFNAVTESRRWRRAASRRMNKMTFEEQQEHLRRATETLYAVVPKR
jgi:hypothetical protein